MEQPAKSRGDAARRIAGAVIGGALGLLAFWFLLQRDRHVLGVVGVGLALGVGIAARRRSLAWGVITGLAAALLSIAAEWWFRPFAADPSFAYFLRHVAELPHNTLLYLLVALVAGFWFGCGRTR